MFRIPIYMDNHATTPVDPRVVEAMLPYFTEIFGNAGSVSHPFGAAAKQAVDRARESIAHSIGARGKEIVFTSGATESNNLALFGVAESQAAKGRHLISVATEHPSVLEPLERLKGQGFEVTLLPVAAAPIETAGRIDLDQLAAAIRPDTILVSVMAANHEIGVVQPMAEIGALCRSRGVLLHCDATQAVGKIPVNVEQHQVDLMSFSAHKLYGPKGVGALYVRRRPAVKIAPQTVGGGQEGGLRSGTINTPGIVGFARALEICLAEMPAESARIAGLRNRLFTGLCRAVPGLILNGPSLSSPGMRLPGNLNVAFPGIDGEALMITMHDVAISAGSACTSAEARPSHVLGAMGLNESEIRGAVRIGVGRFNTEEEIDYVVDMAADAVRQLHTKSVMGG